MTCIDLFDEALHIPAEFTHDLVSATIDTWKVFQHNTQQFRDRIDVRRGPSGEILRQLVINAYDFVYIDGAHDSYHVLEDSVLAFQVVKPGGLLLWDDYEWNVPGLSPASFQHPRPAIDAFLHIYAEKVALVHQGYQVCIQKRPEITF